MSTDHTYQTRVQTWLLACFNSAIAADGVERNDRFIEEALELVQAKGYSAARAHALVDYVFGRPIGCDVQEVGGVMVTLAALCSTAGIDMVEAGEIELARIEDPAVMAKIKAKQAAKPTGSALPVAAEPIELQPTKRESRLAEAVREAAQVFRQYEALHAAKPDRDKAERNGRIAERMEAALRSVQS